MNLYPKLSSADIHKYQSFPVSVSTVIVPPFVNVPLCVAAPYAVSNVFVFSVLSAVVSNPFVFGMSLDCIHKYLNVYAFNPT